MEITQIIESKRAIRRERDAWRMAAAGLFVLSLALNVGLYGANLRADKLHREEVAHVSAVRDQALRELGELSLSVKREELAQREQAEAYEAVGAYQYIGECVITAYCPCVECCGRWADGSTAAGIPATPGVVAVDPAVIPLGSTVVIDGQRYLAADTGRGVAGKHIDVCMDSHEETVAFGVRYEDVWMIND